MATQVGICNMTLHSLGADPIASMTQDNTNARKINAIYTPILRALLRAHLWNFAMKETALSRITTAPVLADFTYIYTLPSDYIRLKKTNMEDSGFTHKIKGRYIYSNSDTLSIEYVALVTDTTQFDDSFVDAFAARMAAELCYSITGEKALVQIKWAEYKEKYQKAVSVDGQEETPDQPTANSWLNARL